MNNNHILMIGNYLSEAGANRSASEELAARLMRAGWEISTASQKTNRLERLSDMLFTAWRQKDMYCVAQIDVFSGTAFIWAEAVAFMLTLLGKPFILTLHGGNLPAFAHHWPGRMNRLLSSASAVTAPSRYLFTEMAHYHNGIRLIPNALRIRSYEFRLRSKPKPCLIWVRAFHQIYNPMMVPAIIANLRKFFPDIALLMIGPDKGDGSLQHVERIAQKLSVSDRIQLILGVPKEMVPEMINRGDVFINTANFDNTPVSVIEALACGCCIISTNVGGIPYLLENEEDALLVPPNDPDAMADAIRRVLTEVGLAEHLSKNARKKAEQFDWSMVLPKWEALFQEVINA